MEQLIDTAEINVFNQKCERALLVTIQHGQMTEEEALAHLDELDSLVETMGIGVIDKITVKLKQFHARYLVGNGKADEIVQMAKEKEADIIIFDDDLSPSQQRNWEKLAAITVIDRHEVILDIFADRASTREAVLQVGLARMSYSLPRLTRAWTHLSRQRGGAKGTRGEGETQLEVDRRIVEKKITHFKKELKKVKAHRTTQRKKRQKKPVPVASIVGYTNAGKSSLLNILTGSDVFIEDKLFATLDPTTRRISLDTGQELLLTDTVGFIRKLPHDLVDAFKSTLEEATLSDFLIHVLDISSHEVVDHHKATYTVLNELNADKKPIITVFNKVDLLAKNSRVKGKIKKEYPDAIFISAQTGEGLDDLIKAVVKMLSFSSSFIKLKIPHNRYDLVAYIHRNGKVISEKFNNSYINIKCQVSNKMKMELQEYLQE